MGGITMIVVHYNGIADCSFERTEFNEIDIAYEFGRSYYGWSANPVRDAVCEELNKRGRHFNTKECFRPTLYDFLTERSRIYFTVLNSQYITQHMQVWEGVSFREMIENWDVLKPRVEDIVEHTRFFGFDNGFGKTLTLNYMLDKFCRMKSPVQMASYALRKLSQLKR